MKYVIAILALTLFSSSADVASKTRCEKFECDEVRADIREIQARMRSGYTAAQGVRYDARLRRLREKRAKLCR